MSISLHHLTLGYGPRLLLDSISAELPEGQLTALLGRNGTGKSTLLRAIAGLGPIRSGSITLCGRELTKLTPQQRAETVAFVTTEKIRIANMSCEEVVALGRAPYTDWIGRLDDEDRRIVRHALQLTGMESFAQKSMDTLSDGECQRIMIARALAQDTPVMLLDEPTAFLDLPNRYELGTLLRRLAHHEHKCIVFSTHDLDIALSLCDTVALIDPPTLHHLPTDAMVHSGHIERLFSGEGLRFDPATRSVQSVKE